MLLLKNNSEAQAMTRRSDVTTAANQAFVQIRSVADGLTVGKAAKPYGIGDGCCVLLRLWRMSVSHNPTLYPQAGRLAVASTLKAVVMISDTIAWKGCLLASFAIRLVRQ